MVEEEQRPEGVRRGGRISKPPSVYVAEPASIHTAEFAQTPESSSSSSSRSVTSANSSDSSSEGKAQAPTQPPSRKRKGSGGFVHLPHLAFAYPPPSLTRGCNFRCPLHVFHCVPPYERPSAMHNALCPMDAVRGGAALRYGPRLQGLQRHLA